MVVKWGCPNIFLGGEGVGIGRAEEREEVKNKYIHVGCCYKVHNLKQPSVQLRKP